MRVYDAMLSPHRIDQDAGAAEHTQGAIEPVRERVARGHAGPELPTAPASYPQASARLARH
jgi:hypothetical protein